jgi:hypothetical protein
MSVNKILERLETHRKTSANQWVAVCPAHSDRSPSLHIKEKEDGRILIHCKAGCGANEVLDAMGLRYSDLFPDTGESYRGFQRIRKEVLDDYVVEIWNADRELGRTVTREEKERYRQALINGGKPNGYVDELLEQTK